MVTEIKLAGFLHHNSPFLTAWGRTPDVKKSDAWVLVDSKGPMWSPSCSLAWGTSRMQKDTEVWIKVNVYASFPHFDTVHQQLHQEPDREYPDKGKCAGLVFEGTDGCRQTP